MLPKNRFRIKSIFFSVDVAFISLKLILPVARELCADKACAACLIKPQFEAGREYVGKNGVVRDKNVHKRVVENIREFCLNNGFSVLGLDFSPIKGPQGNIEYLIYIEKCDTTTDKCVVSSDDIVEKSHLALD